MSRHCFVFGCNAGYAKTEKVNKKWGIRNQALFSPPKENKLITYR